jgi:nucleoside-diphosphate-sugar epimerase
VTAPLLLVTGATGAAGRHVVPALRAAGFQLRAQYVRKPGEDPEIDWRRWDFRESLDFGPLVEGCAGIVHLGAEIARPEFMDRVNVEATAALAKAAAAAGVRYFGYASSVVVYGAPHQADVDESTPRLDPRRSVRAQYYAEPAVVAYARSKTLTEEVLEEIAPPMRVEFWRPTVVAELGRLLESRDWSTVRKVLCLYRRTQYIFAPDAAAAIAHLTTRGLAQPPGASIEAFNICDEACGRYRDLFRVGFAHTGDRRFRAPPVELPYIADLIRNTRHGRRLALRHGLGSLNVSNARLRATGFTLPTGVPTAFKRALAAHG